jgi:aldose 1-epimerase
MTAPPDAFNSGDDLVVLAPGTTFSATWGIRALD